MPCHHYMRRSCHDIANGTAVCRQPRGLVCATKKGVRRGTNAQACLLCRIRQSQRIVQRYCKRLFGIDVFARGQSLQANGGMMLRGGQVQHDVDAWVRQQRRDG